MLNTLYRRLLVVIVAFGLAMTAAFAFVLLGSHEAYHIEADQTVNRNLAQQYAKARLLISDEPLNALNFHQGIERLAALNPDVDIYLLGPDGSLIASSVPTAQWVKTRIDLTPVNTFLNGTAEFPIFGENPRDSRRSDIFSVAPVSIQDCPARYLYVVLRRNHDADAIRRLRQSYNFNEGLGLLASCGLLAFIATVLLVRAITRRLSTLKSNMEDFETRLNPNDGATTLSEAATGDEIERLTAMFESLSARVRTQMDSLEKTDETRRNMIANISHDLRTPLTTLQAHLDTLSVKNNEMKPAEREQYLETAAKQCRRLTRLVTQLLELAKLDARQVVAQPEAFQIAELIQDIAQKFGLSASSARVTLRADYSSSLPLVNADIGLIERAIDNLTENAIQHSPPGGTVTLRAMAVTSGRVRVEIEDEGPGIAEEEKARLFERFYRGDQSRPSSSGHAGLGLAIAKSILELHGSQISIDSRPEAGSRFSFDLPLLKGMT